MRKITLLFLLMSAMLVQAQCGEVSSLFEDFDSYAVSTLPDCWSKTGTVNATSAIRSGSVLPASAPNKLFLEGFGGGTKVAYAVLPALSNLSAGTHRIRFKAYAEANQWGRNLEIGYFADITNASSFVILRTVELPDGAENAIEFTYAPVGVPSTAKYLFIRNIGLPSTATYAYIDDVAWEPNPTCADVVNIAAKAFTNSGATVTWNAGSVSAWQYAYAPASVKNPNTLTGTDVPGSNPTLQLSGLAAGTKYKVWIRSKCTNDSYGAWMGPAIVETTCGAASGIVESFDASTAIPPCWKQVGKTGSATISTAAPTPSSPNTLSLSGTDTNQFTIVSLPELGTVQSGTHQLRLKVKGSVDGVKLDIGYLTDVTDANTFTYLQTITAGAAFTSETKTLGTAPQSPYLAFRNPGSPAGNVFIDDVVWEPIPTCTELTNITTTVNSNSVKLHWSTSGNESQWEYVLGSATAMNPYSLEIKDLPNPKQDLTGYKSTVVGLSPNTGYRIWIRSKCSGTSFGSWQGPFDLMTYCTPGTEFTEKFDSATAIPSCWNRSGTTGKSVSIDKPFAGAPAPSGTKVLKLEADLNSGAAVIAMPPMSNTADATHRLTFKYRSGDGLGALELGYLLNIGDPTSFKPLGTKYDCTTAFQTVKVELGTDPGSEVLAFRNDGNPYNIMEIDDVVWEVIPPCGDISNLKISSVADTAVKFSWTKGGEENNWQYAIGPVSATSPDGLTYYDVTDSPEAIATKLSETVSLSPETSYKIWVRSMCNAVSIGKWSEPITVRTTCAPIAVITEDFSAGTSLPQCWTRVGTKGQVSIAPSSSEPNDGNKLFLYSGSPQEMAVVALPPLSNAWTTNYVLRFRFKGALEGTKLDVGFIDNIQDPNSFTPIQSYTSVSKQISEVITVSLGPSPVSNILAFRNPGSNTAGVYIDDVTWSVAPPTVPACAANVTATRDENCGNFDTVISWDAVEGAEKYLVDVSLTPDGSYMVKDENVGTKLSYSFKGEPDTKYYYTVTPYNSVGAAYGCAQKSFTTSANRCYCVSTPAGNSGHGITNVHMGTADFVNEDVTYKDFNESTVELRKGTASNDLKVVFDTTYQFNIKAWIDFNDDYIFDENENVLTDISKIKDEVNALDTAFNIANDAALGIHKMRIVTWTGAASMGNPCYNGANGVTLDFKVNVVDTPLSAGTFDDINFSYYPNPVKDMLNLSFSEAMNNVSVVNLLGQQVMTKSLNANQGTIDMSGLSKGAYLVKVTVGNQSKTIKVIKE